jgi:hypothetical protein
MGPGIGTPAEELAVPSGWRFLDGTAFRLFGVSVMVVAGAALYSSLVSNRKGFTRRQPRLDKLTISMSRKSFFITGPPRSGSGYQK